jgi:tellurite resistance protein TerC
MLGFMIWFWAGFGALVLSLLALDLGVFHREAHEIKVKEALGWSAVWITIGLSFTAFIYFAYEGHWLGIGLTTDLMSVSASNPLGHNNGAAAALKYVTGYVIEKSLSVDNIFVIAMVFGATRVPAIYRHRVLFWGILGALIMRGAMIGLGVELIRRFSWTVYLFGGILIATALKMLFMKDEGGDPATSAVVRWARKIIPVTSHFHGEHFFVKAGAAASHEPVVPGGVVHRDAAVDHAKKGAWMATPLFVALLIVEFTDLVFAVDSIPAIFAITTDPFLVFTSNVFAILGLRSLYFALEGMISAFRYLKISLALILILVGVKMMAHSWFKALLGEHFNLWILALVAAILAAGVAASALFPEEKKA